MYYNWELVGNIESLNCKKTMCDHLILVFKNDLLNKILKLGIKSAPLSL